MNNSPESKPEVIPYQYYEALNRTYEALVKFDSLVLGLPVLQSDHDLRQKAGKVHNELWELYQFLSAKHDSAMASEETKP